MAEESKEKELNFEKALKRLEEIVDCLETGGLSLDKSLERFSEGVKLVNYCNQELNKAEEKIEKVLKEGGTFTRSVSFEDGGSNN
ncbi:exodeoxyribonuclease VII small subunit [Halothermothrix orenii]|uniref:Exodeoxyribonuclease 7 small subunit n=1 Tax=Halothermothrix orenii (strain H 168 / OCM 544 / DSM 9562) TaxID=373903 RepID=B8D2I0_HALOH|nr:exodeoxyribonuclease VII small subunit [Halothermothrix orenii]ACL69407.1 exodeoxyribonuclease VII, small subunit [Halothermothrix orenii H 168]